MQFCKALYIHLYVNCMALTLKFNVFITTWLLPALVLAQLAKPIQTACPLETLVMANARGATIAVTDGQGREYTRSSSKPSVSFAVGGALGKHSVWVIGQDAKRTKLLDFEVDTQTAIKDGGTYQSLFEMCYTGMNSQDSENGTAIWNGKSYRYFVPWILDHGHTMKGQKYFFGYGHEFLNLLKETQRPDGMIYSFYQYMSNPDYWLTRDKFSGYSKRIGDKVFVRQPTENHPEYMYVNTIYQAWKSGGDDGWMKTMLASAAKALNYAPNDPARWSKRFQLLKRVYTIDSWDFAVEDEYLPNIGITNSMIIDPDKSKFGVFFGDNTGYIDACLQLAEMFEHTQNASEAAVFRQRGAELKQRLDKLAWNGKFYRHFIDEDPTVVRKLGVDESTQIAQSNTYSLNRPLAVGQAKAIIETYLDLRRNLPSGSPGEFYSIYPPFENGFGSHGDKWQYMNGGVGGHVAGELARGAFEVGYEQYGADILNRIHKLGKQYDNKIYFAYTGAMFPPPPSPTYKPLDLSGLTNMDFWVTENATGETWMRGKRPGDDLRNLPTGEQTLANIKFKVIDPAQHNRKAVVAVSRQVGLPPSVEVPVNDTAACVYLLHTSSKPASENVVGSVKFVYDDGSSRLQYLLNEKHLTYWWFSQLHTERSGIAWYGKNLITEGVGLSWCALDNPNPKKQITKLVFQAPESDGIYALLGVTLADRPHYVPVKGPSFGGPDNWSAALVMAALIEGLAGVKDAPQTQAFAKPLVAPRWVESQSDSLDVHIKYPASNAYVAYKFKHAAAQRQISLLATGSGQAVQYHILLPNGAQRATVQANGKPVAVQLSKVENSRYADFELKSTTPQQIVVKY